MMGRQRRYRWAQPWTLLLLLLGPQLLVTHGWRPQGNENSKNRDILRLYFPAVVEYALHMYNLKSQDRNAYKVVRVLRSWPEWVGTIFSPLLASSAVTRVGRGCHQRISIII